MKESILTFKNENALIEEKSKNFIEPYNIIFDLPSEYYSVSPNTYFFLPFILTNNSTKTIPKGSFFGLKGKSDIGIFIEKKLLTKDIQPSESIQYELDCLSNKTLRKNSVLEIALWNNNQTYEYNTFAINIDVENAN